MQSDRREFVKKSAMVVGASAVVGATTLVASESMQVESNGVVTGKSPKKEILYKKTRAWEDFYSQATK